MAIKLNASRRKALSYSTDLLCYPNTRSSSSYLLWVIELPSAQPMSACRCCAICPVCLEVR